jgi:Fibronectin type III domain
MRPCHFTRPVAPLIYIGLAVIASAFARADVSLSWDPDSDPSVVGYRLYSGTTSGVYTQTMEAGSATSMIVSNLTPGRTYYFAVTAYTSSFAQSGFSNQVSYQVPASPTPTPTASPTASPSPTVNPSATPTPTATPAPTPTPTSTPTPTATPQPSQTPSPSPTPTPSISPSPTVTPSPTATPGTGPAQMLSPLPGSTFTSSTVTFSWTAGSATKYVLFVGRTPFGVDYYVSGIIPTLSCVATNIPTNAHTMYVTLGSQVNGRWTFNQYTYKAFSSSTSTPTPTATPSPNPSPTPTSTPSPSPSSTPSATPSPSASSTPGGAQMLNPVPGSTLASSAATFNWSPDGGAGYFLVIGSSASASDIYQSGFLRTRSATVTNIPTDGRTIYVMLASRLSGSWTFNHYTYKASSSSVTSTPTPTPTPVSSPSPTATPTFTPGAGAAVMLSPLSGSTLNFSRVTFQWTAGNATAYVLTVGSSPGAGDIYMSGLRTTSATITSIPTDSRTIYVRLYSQVNGSWVFNSYSYR